MPSCDMPLATHEKLYSVAFEQILSIIATSRTMTLEEAAMIAYYCGELNRLADDVETRARERASRAVRHRLV